MDIIATLFAEHETLKREQKHRRLDFHGSDSSFYTMSTELAIEKRLEEIRSEVQHAFKIQKLQRN